MVDLYTKALVEGIMEIRPLQRRSTQLPPRPRALIWVKPLTLRFIQHVKISSKTLQKFITKHFHCQSWGQLLESAIDTLWLSDQVYILTYLIGVIKNSQKRNLVYNRGSQFF